MMANLTGMDLYAELSEKMPAVCERMVFLTGGAFTTAAREFLDRVPNHRLEKPCDSQALRAVVNGLLR